MPKLYRKKTETEKALLAIKLWDMSPVKLQYTFGGDASEWGRILKGQHQPHGVYLAICKDINIFGYKAIFTMQAARKKYARKTRHGGIVPRTRNVLYDFDQFVREKIILKRMMSIRFADLYDGYIYYQDEMQCLAQCEIDFESREEENSVERNFLDSLDV
jgi:hypothetical protein